MKIRRRRRQVEEASTRVSPDASFSSPPTGSTLGRRACSVLVDGVAYVLVAGALQIVSTQLGSWILPPPPPSGDPRTAASLLGEMVAVLGANFFLALGNALGSSPGKALTGTRLVARSGNALVRPGMRRGLVWATVQWFPLPRAGLMGTYVVTAEEVNWKRLPPRLPAPPTMPAWVVILAMLVQCPFAGFLMVGSAL